MPETTRRYEIYTHRGEWSLYNIWDNEEGEEIPVGDGSRRNYTRDRDYVERICREMNAREPVIRS